MHKASVVGSLAIALAILGLALSGAPVAVAGDEQAAQCGHCGDGVCASGCGETASNCPRDCLWQETFASAEAQCGRCGDGVCVPQCGETPTSCPIDCGLVF